MKIILFTHPTFLAHQSMPRFAKMIQEGMEDKGHEVLVWSPSAFFFKSAFNNSILEKWLGYLDQYVVFPIQVKLRLLSTDKNSLFVFADNALGPWIPLVNHKYHVVHCHDFLAQQSAFGLLAENKTGFTGKQYQKFIRWGYRKADHFICISKKTKTDLNLMLTKTPKMAQVVYNGLNQDFRAVENRVDLREMLTNRYSFDMSEGYILHVGGNAFYKNKIGVLEIYDQWATDFEVNIPLVLVGELPSEEMVAFKEQSKASKSIYFISNIDDLQLQEFYQGASVLLFPSLYEGFGWPIVEAMASGSLVITTDADPMKEVAAEAGFYIPKKPLKVEELLEWKKNAAGILESVMRLNPIQREEAIGKSILRSQEFSSQNFVNSIEKIYQQILQNK